MTTDPEKEFEKFIVASDHPCVMAQSVFKQNHVCLKTYGTLGSVNNVKAILEDLSDYLKTYDTSSNHFFTFLAVFERENLSEIQFEAKMWDQLQLLHQADPEPWDSSVSSDPNNKNFSFSLLGNSFYIVGMHPNSSRLARQAPYPAMAFNLHSQFERLREQGVYDTTREHIRDRDQALQGTINPMLRDFGDDSEAKQYSGRQVDNKWQCPFHK